MLRIVGGTARGRRLAPPARSTRPTADRVREALFASLAAELGTLGGVRFVDLYAGSGAVGLEALSRGAATALLAESRAGAVAVLRRNVAAVGLPGATVVAAPVERLVGAPPPGGQAADVAFLDPPYDLSAAAVATVLERMRAHGWLAPGATLVVERSSRDGEFAWPAGFTGTRQRRYGDTVLHFGRVGDATTGDDGAAGHTGDVPAGGDAGGEPGSRQDTPADGEHVGAPGSEPSGEQDTPAVGAPGLGRAG